MVGVRRSARAPVADPLVRRDGTSLVRGCCGSVVVAEELHHGDVRWSCLKVGSDAAGYAGPVLAKATLSILFQQDGYVPCLLLSFSSATEEVIAVAVHLVLFMNPTSTVSPRALADVVWKGGSKGAMHFEEGAVDVIGGHGSSNGRIGSWKESLETFLCFPSNFFLTKKRTGKGGGRRRGRDREVKRDEAVITLSVPRAGRKGGVEEGETQGEGHVDAGRSCTSNTGWLRRGVNDGVSGGAIAIQNRAHLPCICVPRGMACVEVTQ